MGKFIGIIAAEVQEMEAIKEIMKNVDEVNIYNLKIFKGQITNKPCLLVKCGVGKVNAARTTQILCDHFDIEYIVNLGSAGALNNSLNIGDIVIAKSLVQHDFDITAFGYKKGYISDTGTFFYCDEQLVEKFKKIKLENQNIIVGIIASGDIFCTEVKMKEKIKFKFDCDCVEMEGAAIAQVCHLNKIPFIVIRSISDTPNGQNCVDFKQYLKTASENCAKFIKNI